MTATRSRVGFAEQSSELAGLLGWFVHMRDTEPVSWDEPFGSWHLFRYADITWCWPTPRRSPPTSPT